MPHHAYDGRYTANNRAITAGTEKSFSLDSGVSDAGTTLPDRAFQI